MLILEKLPVMNVKDEFTDEILDVLKPVHQEVNGELIEVYYEGKNTNKLDSLQKMEEK